MSNVGTTGEIYAAFGRGDMEAILDLMADDVELDAWPDNRAQRAGVPWFKARRGKQGVTEFFAMVAGWEIREFTVGTIMDGGRKVSVEVVMDAVLPTGAAFRDEEIHLWEFDEHGKVTGLRHYVDTAKHIEAAGLEVAAR